MTERRIVARDIMEPVLTVAPEAALRELAHLLVGGRHDGACVVDDTGQLRGVVTAMDLVFLEKRLKGPAIFWLIDSPVILGQSRFEHELHKQAGRFVQDVMTPDARTVGEETGLDEIATLMVDNQFTILPVLAEGVPVGMITKWAVLRHVLEAVPR